jgi:DNA recombination-dependent growth factor C
MGFLSTSTTIVRFFAPVPPRLDREAVAAAVTRRAFREVDPAAAGAREAYGWVGIHDPLTTAFSPADLFVAHWLAVGFRHDRLTVPARLLSLERRRAEAARKAERGVERLGAAERKEIREEVEARLLARALPTPRLFDCAWNLETGRVYLSGRQRAVCEAFAELFRQTFGVRPVPLIPYFAAEHVGLAPRALEAVRAVEPARLAPPAVPRPDSPVPRLPLEEARE